MCDEPKRPKVGDTVRIRRPQDAAGRAESPLWLPDMDSYDGEIASITTIARDDRVYLAYPCDSYHWNLK